ncbi:MAG: hypothetical protein ACI9TY_000411 [Alphaproteobacteria bacterium]|jgi:hypothetical protein
MNVLLFSEDRILYEDGEKGAISSMLIPRYSKIKKYADITTVTDSTVKLRHGDADDLSALWRKDGPYIYVYGNLSKELDEKRSTHNMYLPQDYVGEDVGAFYYIFNNRYVVHGVKSITDDGQRVWGTSLIGEKEDSVMDIVVSSISERMLEGKDERIIVAVHKDENALANFKEALEPFEQKVITFSELGAPAKSVKPLFERKDRSIIMLTLSLCAFLAMVGSVFLWGSGQIELQSQDTQVQTLQEAIRKLQKNKALGNIKNPKAVLKIMNETLPMPPSTLIHTAGEVGAMFGDLLRIDLGQKTVRKRGRQVATVAKDYYEVTMKVKTPANALLLDQERIAKTVVESMPWIKYIERPANGSSKEFKVGVQVK